MTHASHDVILNRIRYRVDMTQDQSGVRTAIWLHDSVLLQFVVDDDKNIAYWYPSLSKNDRRDLDWKLVKGDYTGFTTVVLNAALPGMIKSRLKVLHEVNDTRVPKDCWDIDDALLMEKFSWVMEISFGE